MSVSYLKYRNIKTDRDKSEKLASDWNWKENLPQMPAVSEGCFLSSDGWVGSECLSIPIQCGAIQNGLGVSQLPSSDSILSKSRYGRYDSSPIYVVSFAWHPRVEILMNIGLTWYLRPYKAATSPVSCVCIQVKNRLTQFQLNISKQSCHPLNLTFNYSITSSCHK